MISKPAKSKASKPSTLILLGINLMGVAGTAAAGNLFGTMSTAGTATRPHSIRVGDVNRDGNLDVVVANGFSASVSLLLGNGDGSLQPKQDFPVGRGPKTAELGDLNHDGHLDLVTANQNSRDISVRLGNGSGAFGELVTYPSAVEHPHEGALGDLNHDGKLDVAVVGNSSYVAVRLGRGDGSFAAETTYATGNTLRSVVIADLNSDGYNDIATGNMGSRSISVLLNDRAGGFQPQVQYPAGGRVHSVRAADLDHNGSLDLVTANQTSNSISVLLGNGNGTFGPPATQAAGIMPVSIFLGDVNVDGNADILVGNGNNNYPAPINLDSGNTVSVFLGQGNGTFKPKDDYAVGVSPWSVFAADLNCDGAPELMATSYWEANISIGLNGLGSQVPCGARASLP
ncbi:FG-GAP repeat domain-containing protein [Methylotetracoccus oryzae]|uniref:FG-GAP repeat domain-containing protein n=1 Tax=Methylotetracoccus oryzae TaxID=1919059 RepID=UPI0011192605|nr:VCBS repeat-containing protein [Methylotetracoccus oryzae]